MAGKGTAPEQGATAKKSDSASRCLPKDKARPKNEPKVRVTNPYNTRSKTTRTEHETFDNPSLQLSPSKSPKHFATNCCSCSRHSTCSQQGKTKNSSGCECLADNRTCTTCRCYKNCRNKNNIPWKFSTGPPQFSIGNTGERSNGTNSLQLAEQTKLCFPTSTPPTPSTNNPSKKKRNSSASDSNPDSPLSAASQDPTIETQSQSYDASSTDYETQEEIGLSQEEKTDPIPPKFALASGWEPDEGSDLSDYTITKADTLLDEIYGDHIHDNDGTHLNGGIANDSTWQSWWLRLVQHHPRRYVVPRGKVGR